LLLVCSEFFLVSRLLFAEYRKGVKLKGDDCAVCVAQIECGEKR